MTLFTRTKPTEKICFDAFCFVYAKMIPKSSRTSSNALFRDYISVEIEYLAVRFSTLKPDDIEKQLKINYYFSF